jgi:hypothetical protein
LFLLSSSPPRIVLWWLGFFERLLLFLIGFFPLLEVALSGITFLDPRKKEVYLPPKKKKNSA